MLCQKLRPFFPPLAPLQSINLRAALYRGLTELKKNGILGKEVILRKTMLDECKGDKFEEVLRLFAVAVLREEAKRRFHTASATHTGHIEVLTAPEDLSTEQRERLLPLVLAHRRSLQGQLNESRRIGAEFRDEIRHLEDARVKLREKRKAVLVQERDLPSITQEELDLIANGVQAAWIGNEQWAEVLLHGGPGNLGLPLSGTSYRDGAQQTCSTTQNEPLTHPPNNLLADLNERIEKHHSRLRKWTELRDSLEKSRRDPERETQVETRKPLLNFSAHQGLRPGIPKNESSTSTGMDPQVPSHHNEIIDAMRAELANLRGSNSPRKLPLTKPSSQHYLKRDVQQKNNNAGTITNADGPLVEGISGDSENFCGDGTTGQSNRQAAEYDVWQQDVSKDREDYFSRIKTDGTDGTGPIQNIHIAQQPSEPSGASVPNDNIEQSNTPLPKSSKGHFTESSIVQLPLVSKNRHDDEISSHTPKQGNHPLSPQPRQLLQNQTTPEPPTDPILIQSEPDIFSPANPPLSSSPSKPIGTTLLERTRQSMALLPSSSTDTVLNQTHQPPISQNNHHQQQTLKPRPKHPRPSSSTTLPPTHSNPTIPKHPHPLTRAKTTPNPKKTGPATRPRNQATKTQEPSSPPSSSSSSFFSYSTPQRASDRDRDPDPDLFSEQTDYASVFKSRPRVAVSPPVISSSNGGSPEGGRLISFGSAEGGAW